jgi:hypothetical protein
MAHHKLCLAFLLTFAITVCTGLPVRSAPANAVVPLGVWKVTSFYREDVNTHTRRIYFGAHPNGYLLITDKWFTACITGDNRSKPAGSTPTNAEKLALYNSLIAYIGPYALDGNRITIHVMASWNQSWNGSNQIRFLALDGNQLSIKTAPLVDWLDGRLSTYVLTFKRAQ